MLLSEQLHAPLSLNQFLFLCELLPKGSFVDFVKHRSGFFVATETFCNLSVVLLRLESSRLYHFLFESFPSLLSHLTPPTKVIEPCADDDEDSGSGLTARDESLPTEVEVKTINEPVREIIEEERREGYEKKLRAVYLVAERCIPPFLFLRSQYTLCASTIVFVQEHSKRTVLLSTRAIAFHICTFLCSLSPSLLSLFLSPCLLV